MKKYSSGNYKEWHTCIICGNQFYKKIYLSNIRRGRGKCCSKECKNKHNGNIKKTGEMRKCVTCGNDFYGKASEIKRSAVKYCSRKCWNPTPKGKAVSLDGYYTINGKKVHRIIMEEHIGRKLLPTEIVHHINNDKLDNRIENLQIVSRSEHNKIHKFFSSRKGV